MDAVVRTMTIEDYDQIYGLWMKIKGFAMRSIDDSRIGVERFLKRNPDTSVVAVKDGKVVGAILCGHDGRRGCLYHVCVDPEYRKQGIGTAMVVFAMNALKKEDMPSSASGFSKLVVPYVEVDVLGDFDLVIKNVLAGVTCLFIDGYEACIAIDCRTYPARSVDEPSKDKSLRGSRDGFVETIVFNTALIRRRIRDPHLVMKMYDIGRSSRTDVALCYMEDRVEKEFLNDLKDRIANLNVDALRMNQQSLADALFKRKWFNPFPKFKFTERPDRASVCLLEGKIVLLVDNSPSAMILPTSIFDMIEEANDYYFPTLTNIYLKIARALITLATVFLTPLFLLFMQNIECLPRVFAFVALRDVVNIPLIFQLLILELAIDGMRLAAMNTPSMLSTPLSVIAGIVLGEFAVSSGWFNSEVMLYMSFVAVSNYTQPNFELGYALKLMRMLILLLGAALDVWGLFVGLGVFILLLATTRPILGESYLYPLVPFNARALGRILMRRPIDRNNS